MGLSLSKILRNRVRDGKEQVAKVMADPDKDMEHAISDAEKQIAGFRDKLASLKADLNRKKSELLELNERGGKLKAAALKAKGEDDMPKAQRYFDDYTENVAPRIQELETDIATDEKQFKALNAEKEKYRTIVAQHRSKLKRTQALSASNDIKSDLLKARESMSSGRGALGDLEALSAEQQTRSRELDAKTEILDEEAGTGSVSDAELDAELAGDTKGDMDDWLK